MDRKSISLPLDVFDLVDMIKMEYESETQKKHSYPSIIFMLSQYYLMGKEKESTAVVLSESESKMKEEFFLDHLYIIKEMIGGI